MQITLQIISINHLLASPLVFETINAAMPAKRPLSKI
jgi:hypothetical protein